MARHCGLRFETSATTLADFVADYHVYDSEGPESISVESWILPGWPVIRIILTDNHMSVTIGEQVYDQFPAMGFYGTSSTAMKWCTNGGVTIGIRLTPAGAARLFEHDAVLYRDRIVQMESLQPRDECSAQLERLRHSDQGPAVKGILDEFLLRHMARPHLQEESILALTAILLDETVLTVADASERLSLPIHTLRRLSLRYFGSPARNLIIRTRLLRLLLMIKDAKANNQH